MDGSTVQSSPFAKCSAIAINHILLIEQCFCGPFWIAHSFMWRTMRNVGNILMGFVWVGALRTWELTSGSVLFNLGKNIVVRYKTDTSWTQFWKYFLYKKVYISPELNWPHTILYSLKILRGRQSIYYKLYIKSWAYLNT